MPVLLSVYLDLQTGQRRGKRGVALQAVLVAPRDSAQTGKSLLPLAAALASRAEVLAGSG